MASYSSRSPFLHAIAIAIFHVNDIHARLDEFSSSGTDCTAPEKGCYGGYARIKHTVDELRAQTPHSILLNAGDEFQGTLFYTYYVRGRF